MNNKKLVTGSRWMGCYIWYSEEGTAWRGGSPPEGTGRGSSPPRPLLAVPYVTALPPTATVPITVLLYNFPLLCSFNVPKIHCLIFVLCNKRIGKSESGTTM